MTKRKTTPLTKYLDAKGRGSRAALARELGILQSHLCNIESGAARRRPRAVLAAKISDITGIPIREILGV